MIAVRELGLKIKQVNLVEGSHVLELVRHCHALQVRQIPSRLVAVSKHVLLCL